MTLSICPKPLSLGLGIAAGFAFLAGVFASQQATAHDHGDKAHKTQAAAVGKAAPEFTLKDQDGNDVTLSEHKGKIVVLEWFNDQCPFVVKFYKNGDMNRLAEEAGDDVVWLAVDSSSFSNVAENKKIAGEWSIDRPLLDDASGEVGRKYGARTTPHMYVIDTNGILAYAGAIDDKSTPNPADIDGATNHVLAAIEAVRNGETPTPSETRPYGCSVKY